MAHVDAGNASYVGLAQAEGVPLTFEKGQVLFYQGHHPFGGFYIEQGHLELRKRAAGGREQKLASPGVGDFAGLTETLEGIPYESTAVSLTRCRVYFVSRPLLETAQRKV